MYARTVGDKVLTFGVSGMLVRDALVMYDRQTDSLWTQVDGRAVKGALAGRSLALVPSVHATWKEWLALYPDSRVLRKRGEFRTPYADYNRSPSKLGILGRRNPDERLPGKERILGIRHESAAVAFPLKDVRRARRVNAQVGALPIVLAAPSDHLPVLAYQRRAGNRILTFEIGSGQSDSMRDRETGSRWRVSDGVALEGPLAGTKLARAPAYPAFWFGWRSFFPDTTIWTPAPEK